MEANKAAIENIKVVERYSRALYLDKAEIAIFKKLFGAPKDWNMLDIGIGAGRTTHYFAPVVKKYVGIDYSEAMSKICEDKYGGLNNVTVLTADARNMDMFPDEGFDFVLFSFNGIDFVSAEDRQKILLEMKRVAKTSSLLCFSSHNMYNLPVLYGFRYPFHPRAWLAEYRRILKLKRANKPMKELRKMLQASIADGDPDFTTQYIYIRPDEQIKQLRALGFTNIEVYSFYTGARIDNSTDWSIHRDPWIYYLFTKA